MKQIHIFTVFSTAESFFDGQFKYLTDQGGEIILVSSNHNNAKDFSIRNNIRFVPIEMPRAMSPLTILKAIRAIIILIRKEKPDVIFGHTPVGALCAMIAAKWCGIKNRVYYRHGVIYTTMKGFKRKVFQLEEIFVSSLSTSIINVSHSLSRLAIHDNLNPENKQYVIGHGTCGGINAKTLFNPELIESHILELKRKYFNLENVDIVFGFCGRICSDKGIPELIDGFELFQEQNPDIKSKLLLVGDFDLRDGLSKAKLDQIKNNKNIIITGKQEKEIIPYLYILMDVFVFPSHREGFGMCVIEASAMQKPILVSRSHGCEDSIIEHKTGEYIDLTPQGICKGMNIMLNKEVRISLGKSGREMVLKWYDFMIMWPLVKELYNRILK